jgi:protease-4
MTRPITKDEEAVLQELIDDTYNQFVDIVAEGRGLTREEVLKVADGRIFTGAQALQLGLIDKLGNLQDAIALAADMVGIEGEPKVIYPKKKRPSLLEFLLEGIAQGVTRIVEKVVSEKLSVYSVPTPH